MSLLVVKVLAISNYIYDRSGKFVKVMFNMETNNQFLLEHFSSMVLWKAHETLNKMLVVSKATVLSRNNLQEIDSAKCR